MPTPEEVKAAQEAEKKQAEAQAAAAAKAKEGSSTDDVAGLKAQLEKEKAERQAANAEAQKHRKRLREIEEQNKKAEEQALVEAGKHKELAEARGKEIEATRQELEQLRSEKAKREAEDAAARAAREAQVATEFAQLPDHVRAGIPADADARSKEIAVNTFRAMSGQKVPTPAPTAPSPSLGGAPAGDKPTQDEFARAFHPSTSAEEKARLQKKIADYQKSVR